MPTAHPFLFTVSVTANEGTALDELREETLAELDDVRVAGLSGAEVDRARRQLQARVTLENNSITNVAHQLGFFETVSQHRRLLELPTLISEVTEEDVSRVAARYLVASNRTVGVYRPA